MQINKAKFEAVVKEAKVKAAGNARWISAIDRAAAAILGGELIVTTLAHGALVTSANGSYLANGSCQCKAAKSGHRECYHRAAARLVELYETAPEAASPAGERSTVIAEIKSIWPRFAPGLPLATELMARFGKNRLEMLDDDYLRRVRLAVAM